MIVPDRLPLVANSAPIGSLLAVKERMRSFGDWTRLSKMICQSCIDQKAHNPRAFRSWDALRTHLVGYHRIDHREIPE